jgi:hypothetical protein
MIDFDRMGGLYDHDLVLWTEEQARELRVAANAGWNAPLIGRTWPRRSRVWANPNAASRQPYPERDRAPVEAADIADD